MAISELTLMKQSREKTTENEVKDLASKYGHRGCKVVSEGIPYMTVV